MPERRKSRSRLSTVRVGRSPAAASPSPPSRRRRKSGSESGARGLRMAVHPAPLGPSPRSRTRREGKGRGALARSASEPALWFGSRVHTVSDGLDYDSPPSPPPPPPLERLHTCFDVFVPDLPFGHSPSAASLAEVRRIN